MFNDLQVFKYFDSLRGYDDVFSSCVERKDNKWLLILPGVGKANIEIEDKGLQISVKWKENGHTFERVLTKLGTGDTVAEYIDGILYISNTANSVEPKKIEIK